MEYACFMSALDVRSLLPVMIITADVYP